MSDPSHNPRYTAIAIALHWAIAAMILFMIWLGWNMEDNESRFQLHKSIGITILILSIARILWRRMNPPPALPEGMPAREKRLSHFVAMTFYVLMIALPLAGWLLVSISEFKVPTVLYGLVSWPNLPFTSGIESELLYDIIETLHSKGAWVIIVLLALHVAGALKHEFSSEDGVLKRMLPGLFGKTGPPRAPSRGFFIAFGAAAALFALIASLPLLAGAQEEKAYDASLAALPTDIETNWEVDYAASAIIFEGVHEGNDFSGTFTDWQALVAFFPDNLDASEVHVSVNLASAHTGTKLYDDSLRAPEWFDVKNNSQAKVTLTNFRVDDRMNIAKGTAYIADATLYLKEAEISIPLLFTLIMDGDTARLEGEATLSRNALGLGQESDPKNEWVADNVTVRVRGAATRKN